MWFALSMPLVLLWSSDWLRAAGLAQADQAGHEHGAAGQAPLGQPVGEAPAVLRIAVHHLQRAAQQPPDEVGQRC